VLHRSLRFLSSRSLFWYRAPSPAVVLAEAAAFMAAGSEVEAAVFVGDSQGPVVARFVVD
jgi:hypothetical protein